MAVGYGEPCPKEPPNPGRRRKVREAAAKRFRDAVWKIAMAASDDGYAYCSRCQRGPLKRTLDGLRPDGGTCCPSARAERRPCGSVQSRRGGSRLSRLPSRRGSSHAVCPMKVEVISTRRITEQLIRKADQDPVSWWQRIVNLMYWGPQRRTQG
jgi:hypothetical protein